MSAAAQVENTVAVIPTIEPSEAPTNNVIELESFEAKSAVDEALAEKMFNMIKAVVADSTLDDKLQHPTIAMAAEDHTAGDIADLLKHLGVQVEGTTEAIAPYLATLTRAKELLKAYFTPGKAEPASSKSKADKGDKPKAGKTKGGKAKAAQPKADKQPKEKKELPIVEADVFLVDGAAHELPEARKRADGVPRPESFFLEGTKKCSGTPHQVDPSRLQSYTPLMPNLDLLEKTGNPYPAEAPADLDTSDRYKPLVTVSHETYKLFMATEGDFKPRDPEVVAKILDATGQSGSGATTCISDAMRDLALYGLVKQFTQGRTRIFRKS